MARFNYIAVMIASSVALSSCVTSRRSQQPERPPVTQAPASPIAREQPAAPKPAAPTPAAPAPAAPAPAAPTPAPTKPVPPPTAIAPNTASPRAPAGHPVAKPGNSADAAAVKSAPPEAPKPPTLDLPSLEQRLKDTRAIGVFTKLSLKNQVDDLLSDLRAYHAGSAPTPQAVLRQKYDTLIIKVLTLLQNGDPQLATAVASSREALWGILMDPKKFSQI
jgi:hypothetical protein